MMMQDCSVRQDLNATTPVGGRGALGRVTRLVAGRLSGLWTRHRDETLLQTLSDHQLRDLGIRRGDIGRVVRHGRGW